MITVAGYTVEYQWPSCALKTFDSASATVAGQRGREGPLRPRPYMVVGEMPATMAVPGAAGLATGR